MSLKSYIWRRETPLANWLHRSLKRAAHTGAPIIPGIHHALLGIRKFYFGPWAWVKSKTYYEPLLKLTCKSVGPGLLLYEDMPKLLGNIDIEIGRNVVMSGKQVWIGAGSPTSTKKLHVSDYAYIGYAVEIIVGTTVYIGKHARIANHVILNGYDGHPIDPLARARGDAPGNEGQGTITIGDYAWIGARAMILKDVHIGRGSVVAAGAVVTNDVPELTVVGGVPARPLRSIPKPNGWES